MAGVGGRMVVFAFSLVALGCTPYNKNISSKPPIVETAAGDSMQKFDTTKRMDLGVVPKKDTSKIDTMQALPPINCSDLEK